MFRRTYVGQCNRGNKSVEKSCCASGKFECPHSFGTHIIRHNLCGVNWLHRRVCKGEYNSKEVDEKDRGRRGSFAATVDKNSGGSCGHSKAYDHPNS